MTMDGESEDCRAFLSECLPIGLLIATWSNLKDVLLEIFLLSVAGWIVQN